MLPSAVACPQCGAAGDAEPSRVIPLLGIAAILVGALLPFSRVIGIGRLDAFSEYVSHALVHDEGFGVVFGTIMVAAAIIAGVLVVVRTRVVWPVTLAVLAAAPALWFIGDWLVGRAGDARFDRLLRSIGTGPWLALFGLALVVVGARRTKSLLAVSALAVIGGAFYVGFNYPVSLLWDRYTEPVWYVATSFFTLVLFIPGLVLALYGKAPWVAFSLIASAVVVTIVTSTENVLDYASHVGLLDALEGSDVPTPIVAGGVVAMVLVAQQARRRGRSLAFEQPI